VAGWFRASRDGFELAVRLTPKAGMDRIDGVFRQGGAEALAARVRPAPEKGAANAALEKLIARALGVAASQVAVVAGHKARLKRVQVSGEASMLEGRLASLGAGQTRTGKDE
jgi:uncharacterized protein